MPSRAYSSNHPKSRVLINPLPEPYELRALSLCTIDVRTRYRAPRPRIGVSRLEDVAVHFGATRQEMVAHGLKVLSFAGRDAILGRPDRGGIIKPRPLFEHIRRDALQLRPKLIVLDTVADMFGGDEIKRGQVLHAGSGSGLYEFL